MNSGFLDLGIIVVGAAVFGVVARFLRQPIVLGYLIAGVLAGLLGLTGGSEATLRLFSDLGIMFLLFLVGLEVNYGSLRLIGGRAAALGIAQIALTALGGYAIARIGFGFGAVEAGYLAAAISFSSTIIAVKLLSEKRDLQSLYGKLTLGVLLVQDFAAILILMALGGGSGAGGVLTALGKGVLLSVAMLWIGRRALPYLLDRVARSEELLFVVSLAWLFLVAAAVQQVGFSIEIAGFLAGIALANSSEHFRIAQRIRALRDFFILVFFVILGSSLAVSNLHGLWPAIAVLTLFVLVLKPFIVMAVAGLMGYRRRTGFLTGVSLAQVSEFSLVLAAVGLKLGQISAEAATVVTAVGVATIIISTYFIAHAEDLFRMSAKWLSVFERKRSAEGEETEGEARKAIILVGAHRTGESIVASLPKEDLLVIDFDPDVAGMLEKRGIAHLLGDISDPEIRERAHISEARLLISTSPDFGDNMRILESVRDLPRRPKIIVRAESEAEAKMLYDAGADYVLLPHFTAGQYLAKTISHDPEAGILASLKEGDLSVLNRDRHRF